MKMIKIEFSDMIDCDDNFSETIIIDEEKLLATKINNYHKKLFKLFPHKIPTEDISSKDLDIVSSFTNEKSFERAIAICMKLLSSYAKETYEDNVVEDGEKCNVTKDSYIVINCIDILVDCKIPHYLKPGFLIILIKYCYYKTGE